MASDRGLVGTKSVDLGAASGPNDRMAQAKRRATQMGLGVTDGSVKETGKRRRFTSRDTLPAPRDEATTTPTPAPMSGQARRETLDISIAFEGLPKPEAKPASMPAPMRTPAPAPAAAADPTTVPPVSGPRSKGPRESIARASRDALRVDSVDVKRARKITLRESVAATPRVVNSARIREAPIDARHAFVLSLIDGKTTIPDLADVAGLPEADVDTIVARLVRLGIAAM